MFLISISLFLLGIILNYQIVATSLAGNPETGMRNILNPTETILKGPVSVALG